MSRVQTTRRVHVPAVPNEVQVSIETACRHDGSRFRRLGPNLLEVRRGGSHAAMHMFGALLPPRELPVVGTVATTPLPGAEGTVVDVTVVDDLQFGFRTGNRKRFQTAVDELVELIVGALPTAAP